MAPNTLPEHKRKSALALFFKQFQRPLIYLFLAAAIIAFFLYEVSDAAVILVVVILNSLTGQLPKKPGPLSASSQNKLKVVRFIC